MTNSRIHQQDVDGCNYTMSILTKDLRITDWTHTEGNFDKYDMDWTATTDEGEKMCIMDENKDRRYGWKTICENGVKIRVKDYDKPQYLTSYPSQMFNFEKYEFLMEKRNETGAEIAYTAGYLDGVWMFDLATLPRDLIYKPIKEGGWKIMVWVEETTMDGYSVKKLQPRFLIPNQYGDCYKR